jgi:hypothetical protein
MVLSIVIAAIATLLMLRIDARAGEIITDTAGKTQSSWLGGAASDLRAIGNGRDGVGHLARFFKTFAPIVWSELLIPDFLSSPP